MISREKKRFSWSGRRGSLFRNWYRLRGSLLQPLLMQNLPGAWSWPGISMVRAKET
ncbi:MAG: hypothetical protein RQ867_01980 [Mariprofundaceae bacterium]|nr:hypothetical protein [Mariprofundaceae bacterium]